MTFDRRRVRAWTMLGVALVVLAAPATSRTTTNVGDPPADSAVAAIGKKIFFDSTLSASGRLSCARCHDPDHAYGPANDLSVQRGGPALDRQGVRAAPSLRYVLNRTPRYYEEYVSNIAERLREGSEAPAGGFGDDGRFGSLHEQAAFPLLASNEMANASPVDVVTKLRRAAYGADFRRVFGADVFDLPSRAFARALYAIERFELTDYSFHPYDSKFDLYLDGNVELTQKEQRGRALFDDPRRGNCASCHVSEMGANGSHPLFTDFQFEALGVPRNAEIAANRDSTYFDEGLCGPARRDLASQRELCGMFKTPSLRNVATRGALFHNGRFHTLRDALRFYVDRDSHPEKWYPRSHTGVDRFDDLPAGLRSNVDTIDLPLARRRGQPPLWSEAEIDDVIAFLETLNDGYRAADRTQSPH
ncbi:MAG TPA: cytochrome c peroxidase [Gemmatimonadaceae bacterium]|jgi:cytochrome c peroxidase|nr:cytochrome c peroxidase [Gemmatimonadaceae bacterium]